MVLFKRFSTSKLSRPAKIFLPGRFGNFLGTFKISIRIIPEDKTRKNSGLFLFETMCLSIQTKFTRESDNFEQFPIQKKIIFNAYAPGAIIHSSANRAKFHNQIFPSNISVQMENFARII